MTISRGHGGCLVSDAVVRAAVDAARAAGRAILPHYRRLLAVTSKVDGSPLTAADRAAHEAIEAVLAATGVPLVSEEGSDLKLGLTRYWLVDPLDGTKDFLAGNDEFTVNVALVEGDRVVFGVVYAPATDSLWSGGVGHPPQATTPAGLRPAVCAPASPGLRVAGSRFHDPPDGGLFAEQNLAVERVPRGSALKYCQLADAEVDVFPRLVGCSEWDTAAGQAILEATGGQVLDWHTGDPLRYGKPGRRNPRLLSFRAPYTRDSFHSSVYSPELL